MTNRAFLQLGAKPDYSRNLVGFLQFLLPEPSEAATATALRVTGKKGNVESSRMNCVREPRKYICVLCNMQYSHRNGKMLDNTRWYSNKALCYCCVDIVSFRTYGRINVQRAADIRWIIEANKEKGQENERGRGRGRKVK